MLQRFRGLQQLFTIRPANPKDVSNLSDILTESFYRNIADAPSLINLLVRQLTNWVYPLLRYGITIDLNSRFNEQSPCYICLVATHPANKSQAIASLEICMRSVPIKPRQGFWQDLWQWQGTHESPYIFNLAVHPQWRRRGVAKQLLLAAEQTAKQWGFSRLYIHVLEDNYAARSLYDRLGYHLHSQEGTMPHYLLGRPRQFLLKKKL